MKAKHVIVLDIVGLTPTHLNSPELTPNLTRLLAGGRQARLTPVFPALTLPVQASLTTGRPPAAHGIIANGLFFPERFEVAFWEQAASLVQSERIWDRLRRHQPGLTTATLFMQHTLHASCDVIVTPRPLHTEEGLIPWCYTKPAEWYDELTAANGDFNLMAYWGPMAGIGSSTWIASTAIATLRRFRPNLTFVYLPHLDYCCQRLGPDAPEVLAEVTAVDAQAGRIIDAVTELSMAPDTVFLVLSEYALHPVTGDIPVNKILREQGLLKVRTIRGREYLDMELSPAFAMVDHQVAHVYIKEGCQEKVRRALETVPGIAMMMADREKSRYAIDHARSGDLVLVAARNRWFSYSWWDDRDKEPDFAGHVDIHRKPGYDPLELFLEPGTRRISQDTTRIRGSHGFPPVGPEDEVPLVLAGPPADDLALPATLPVTAVAGLIEELLLGRLANTKGNGNCSGVKIQNSGVKL